MHTNNVSTIRPQGLVSGNNGTAAPETDGFDFMSYFLGLQVGGSDTNDGLASLIGKTDQAPTEQAEDPLLALFQKGKKGDPSWSAMLPNQMPGVANNMSVKPSNDGDARQVGQPMPMIDGKQPLLSARQEKTKSENTAAQELTDANASDVARETAVRSGVFDMQAKQVQQRSAEQSLQANVANGNQPEAMERVKTKVQEEKKVESGQNGTPLTQSLLNPFGGKEEVTGTEKKQRRDDADLSDQLMVPGQTQNVAQNPTAIANAKHAQEAHTVPELFNKVESMVHNGGGKMTVTMSPAHLGQVEIQVTTRGKKVEIEMKSTSDLAKSVIESRLSDLKQSLHGQDLQLSKVEVQVGKEVARTMTGNSFASLANGNQSFTGQSQQFHNGSSGNGGDGRRGSNGIGSSAGARGISALSATNPMKAANTANGRVDIRI